MGLSIKVFCSSDENDGFGVTSTIIIGEKEAILVDSQFTLANAYRLLADIIETQRKLTKIFITHLHHDHYLGLQVIKGVYPNAEVVSFKNDSHEVNDTCYFKSDCWDVNYLGDNDAKEKIYINKIEDNSLFLEGYEINILIFMIDDCIRVTPLWIPSIRTLIASDLVFSNTHVWISDMRTPERIDNWIRSLDYLENLKADVVVPGHSSLPATLSPSAIDFTRDYIKNFIRALYSVKDSKSLQNEMNRIYKDLPLGICLEYSSKILKDNVTWSGDWPESLRVMKSTL
ncbi:MBL fold metallo-hydrolase [Pantoea ananatis]|uniref:MBL fold metallo-hydrolase n=1 Tax=Pantoea ananas TaxID=553 RepID=UPI003FA4918E